jgi:two-component system sensor histidine kinase/response regulator
MNINILIVDDIESNLYSLESLIKELKPNKNIMNINILKSLSGEEALKISMSNQIDLILLDIQMPGMNGFEVAKFIKSNSKTKDIPIIFLTAAFKSEDFVKYGFEIGAIDYFTKPIEKYQFLNKLALYIDIFSKNKKIELLNSTLRLDVAKEVDKLREKDAQLIHQSRLAQLGEMISMIAHQWRQPLSAISAITMDFRLALELDELTWKTEEDATKSVAYIENSLAAIDGMTENLSTIIDDFRYFYRQNKQLVNTSLENIVTKSINIIKMSLIQEKVEFIYNYHSKDKIDLYDSEMMQVVLSLVKNAQDNFKDKGILNPTITITTKDSVLTISDNGGGIPDAILEKIFDPYFSTKNDKHGTGIGLYMSKLIVEEHHDGTITVENKPSEDGLETCACFTINLNSTMT